MLTIGLKTGLAWAAEIKVEGDEHSDILQLIDDYYDEHKDLPVALYSYENIIEFAKEAGEPIDTYLEQYVPINGGQYYILGIEYVNHD